jgi:spermidine/putrescine transport system ATP-binding protein
MASVVLQRVCKSYASGPVVSNVDIDIPEGEFLVLLGPSGCGKTTTLRMIAGFVQPTSGVIRIGGDDVTWMPPRKRHIGMVFQDYSLFPNMTVWDNVAFGLAQRKVGKKERDKRVGEYLDLIRLPHLAQRFPDALSGGQKQRVALARALACRPRVLLMDEPLGALDLKLREAMQDELRSLQRELGITTVMVTHDQDEAMNLADRIVVMNGGTVQQIGVPEDIYLRPCNRFVADFIGKANFLSGTVVGGRAGEWRVSLPGGASVTVKRDEGMTVGQSVELVLRPEAVQIGRGDLCLPNQLSGIVKQRRFLGNAIHYFITMEGGYELVIEQTGKVAPLDVNEPVHVGWAPGEEQVFPTSTGDARESAVGVSPVLEEVA